MSKKLLLADDSITIQKVIGITFANEDYALSVVDNGDAALEKARAEQPDLILADVFMPGKNGYELCAAVKAQAALKHIPVLLLAGTFEPFDEAKARRVGADGWIAKPFESQALIDRVEELLARTGTAVSAPSQAPTMVPAAETVSAVSTVSIPPVEEEDTEPDLWAELGQVEAPVIDPPETIAQAEPPAAESPTLIDGAGIDDLWGEVSLGEDDLIPVSSEKAPVDIWQDLETAPAETASPIAEPVAAGSGAGDLWEDLPTPAEPEPTAISSQAANLPAALEGEEEEIFLTLEDEEETADLLEPSASDAEDEEAFIFVEDDELAQDLSEAAAQPVEDATTFVAAEAAEEELLELDESDILPLDDVDIVAEDELESLEEELELLDEPLAEGEEFPEEVFAEEPAAAADSLDDLLIGDLAPLEPLESVVETPSAETFPAAEEGSLLVDSELEDTPLWDIETPEVSAAPELAVEELFAAEAEVVEPASTPEPVAPATPALAAAAAEAQVQGLSEADLTRIVERVAGEVIEKLAGTILERMAWEVVPDLAETLIREEIRKIRDNVA